MTAPAPTAPAEDQETDEEPESDSETGTEDAPRPTRTHSSPDEYFDGAETLFDGSRLFFGTTSISFGEEASGPDADLIAYDVLTGAETWRIAPELPAGFEVTSTGPHWFQLGDAVGVVYQGASEGSGLSSAEDSAHVMVFGIEDGRQRGETQVIEGLVREWPSEYQMNGAAVGLLQAEELWGVTSAGELLGPVEDGGSLAFLRDGGLQTVNPGAIDDAFGELQPDPGQADQYVYQVSEDRILRVAAPLSSTASAGFDFTLQVLDASAEQVGEAVRCEGTMPYTAGARLQAPTFSPSRTVAAFGSSVIDVETGEVTCVDDLSDLPVEVHAVADDGRAWVGTREKHGILSPDGELTVLGEQFSKPPSFLLEEGVFGFGEYGEALSVVRVAS